jgi:hypothetical protein
MDDFRPKVQKNVDKWISCAGASGAKTVHLFNLKPPEAANQYQMKTVMTLIMAVVLCASVFAQAGPQAPATANPAANPAASKLKPLSHDDSLVLAETGSMAPPEGGLTHADTLAILDSLNRADSLLRARVKVVAFPSAIDSVLRDFPYNLRHITGELVLAQGEFENYASLVVVPESQSCVVTRYHSADDTTASWQAKMFSSDNFDEANQEYQQLYRKLKTCYVKFVDGSVFYLEGQWEPAKSGASFTTSTLRLMTGDWRYKDVKVELELVYLLADWAVNINIVSKLRDDEVGGEDVRGDGRY